MVMIEISESKVEKMSDYAEKMVRYGGKLMQCLEELSNGESMSFLVCRYGQPLVWSAFYLRFH